MSNVIENENVVEVEVVNFSLSDQAQTVFSGMQNLANEVGEQYEQSFIASTGLDEQEASVKEETARYMKENGFASCPFSLAGIALIHNVKADAIPRTIASRIKALCDFHLDGKSYKVKISDLADMAVCDRKGKKDWRKEVVKAIAIIQKNTTSHFEKNGTEVRATNPVLFSIENKVNKADSLLVHFNKIY